MELSVTGLNIDLTNESRTDIKQKTRQMFTKVCDSIQRIKVVINDINGPRGGKDMHCRVIIYAKGMPDIVVSDNQTTVLAAVNIALSRAKTTLLRKVKRKQQNQPNRMSKHLVEDVTEPNVTEPNVTEPNVTEPDVTEPNVTKQSVTQ